MAGSMGMSGEIKVGRMREMALTKRMPMIWLLDSAGARIQEAVGSLFAGSGYLFQEEVVASGVIPQVAALMGPCAAGTAYIPGLADFVPMVKGRGSMALAGPHLVRAAIGEDVTQEELGGSRVHCRKSGVGDLEVGSDEECIERIKEYLSYMPSHNGVAPPIAACTDPIDRADEELLDVLPESNRKPHDMYEIIRRIVDDGVYFDMKPQFAKTIITCFARFGGRPCGIVANQPKHLGGILDNDSADKAARFVNLCNAYGIPLLFLQDVTGFMVGTKVEAGGIIRHGAKMLYAVSRATVPKITVLVRKAYGAGYYVMCGRAYEPDLIVAWPGAEISVMGAEGAVNIIGRGVSIENFVTIGSRNKFETNCYITAYSQIDDYCFVAPCVATSNDNYMARDPERFKHFKGVTLERGARIGVNATILPGKVLAEDACVAGGAVVSRDVPPGMIVLGSPAKPLREVPEEQLLKNNLDKS